MAPSIDSAVGFHRLRPEEPWLLARAESTSAHAGIVGGRGDVWSRDGALVATGTSQMLCRPMRA
jgi:acyl-CoA thioesterase